VDAQRRAQEEQTLLQNVQTLFEEFMNQRQAHAQECERQIEQSVQGTLIGNPSHYK
jgi:hypothetical protein